MTSQLPTPLNARSVVVADREQVSSDLAGETVVLSMRNAHYFGFTEVGSRVWELLQSPTKVSEICRAIAREYDVAPEECESDVLAFIQSLAEKELVEVTNGD